MIASYSRLQLPVWERVQTKPYTYPFPRHTHQTNDHLVFLGQDPSSAVDAAAMRSLSCADDRSATIIVATISHKDRCKMQLFKL